uniref:Uncharacterized protein n=1 Tax=Babesia bovis TaxID=5865 RepID=A7ARW8_BABBO|eukprot:XP_001610855.1 hypothetical protein [Babesia bovis T2Bo]
MINNEDDDPYAVYRRYAEMSVCIVYNLEKNADETVRSVSEIKCPGNGAWNLSAIRHSITVTYQEKYMLQPNEIMALEPLTSAIQLVTTITDGSTGKLPTELFHRMTKQKGQNLKIKNDMELFDLTFMLSHPLVANCILAYAIGMIKDTSDAIISLRAGMDEWLALLALGDICCTKSFLKPLKSEGKPVSLSKLVSYVYPLDKGTKHGGNDLPPFLTNITIQKTSKQGNAKDENMDSHLSFHELLLMYMPRIDISALKKFMAVCDDFYLIRETTNDIKADGTQLLRSILEAYQEPNLDPRGLIQKMSTAVENHRDTASQKYILALEKLHGKFKFINSSVMGILTNTSNITKLFQKMVGLKIIAKGVTHKMSRPVIKPVLYEEIKKLGFSAMNLVEFDSLAEFIANITIQGQLAAFIPLYALAAKRGSSQEIERHINNIYG